MYTAVLVALFLCNILQVTADYGPNSDVIQVDDKSFKKEVMQHKGVVIVEFYAPWCGHCKNLEPEYEKAASTLSGVAKVVAVDATQNEKLAQQFQVQGFPTLKIFGQDKKSPINYEGARTADGIVSEVMKQTNKLVKDRKGGKSSSSSSSSGGGEKKKKGSGSEVVELTDASFNAMVLEGKEHWLVEFYAPWCGHCKNLAPEWKKAASSLKGSGMRLAAVDATAHQALAQKYGIKGYPSIKLFAAGGKAPVDYQGPRTAEGIVEYAQNYLAESGVPPSVNQIVSADAFKESCEATKLCAIVFVPHILDSGASGRNSVLELIGTIANKFRTQPFTFVWSEAGAQSSLEEALMINSVYPSVAVMSYEKKMFAVNRISWSKKNIESFLNGVLSGGERTSAMEKEPSLVTVSAWDGKDGEIPKEEFSLDEL